MEQSLKEKTFKQMLFFALIALTMSFAGLTSAYVISRKREDWVSFDMPKVFYLSTLLIILSSMTFYLAKRAMQKENRKQTNIYLLSTLVLGIGFIYFQFQGYLELTRMGLFFTGSKSNVAASLFDVIAVAHAVHVLVGIIIIMVLLIKNYQKKYSAVNHLGITLGEIFWHFLGALWVFLFIFFLLVI